MTNLTLYHRVEAIRDTLVEARKTVTDAKSIVALTEGIHDLNAFLCALQDDDADEKDEEPKESKMPERFDMDAMILDMWMPNNQMAVWNPPATGICS